MNASVYALPDPKGFLQQLSYVLKTIFLLFPSILFIMFTWQAFWVLSQGKDILIAALERDWVAGFFLIAVIFYVLVTWYTGRVLLYSKTEIVQNLAKKVQENTASKELPFYLQVIFNIPRFSGYFIFSLMWIGFLKLVYWPKTNAMFVSNTQSYWLLFVVSALYILQYMLTRSLRDKLFKNGGESRDSLRKKLLITAGVSVLVLIILNLLIRYVWLLIISIILIQFIFLFIVVIRRNIKDILELPHFNDNDKEGKEGFAEWKKNCGIPQSKNGPLLLRFMYFANIPVKERSLLIAFNFLGMAALIIYISAIWSFSWSVVIGSLTFIMLAFGVLVLVFSFISIVSVAKKINLHFLMLVLAIFLGLFKGLEPHKVTLNDNEQAQQIFASRPDLKTYFSNWVSKRGAAIDSSSEYPVVFELADGGASRSGYWTASILASLDSMSNGGFSSHLFCLSGASGGSVGNAAYYAWLAKRYRNNISSDSSVTAIQNYLSENFLTYTLARMLGPDVLRFLLPLFGTDRADALRIAMDEGGTGELKGEMGNDVLAYIGDTALRYNLPILCINTTHMQDARPAAVSTIKIDDTIYGKRFDVLRHLPPDKSIELSASTILGARFPYISPAGRIDENDSTFHYYVDGGYFDNSGGGFVHETILYLHHLLRDTASADAVTKERYRKIRFYVLHAMNSPVSAGNTAEVPPLQNDLMAPILTLMGSYESQTSVNNTRLINYLEEINKHDTSAYIPVGLYDDLDANDEANKIPMNWSISKHFREKIDEQLAKQMQPGKRLPIFLKKLEVEK